MVSVIIPAHNEETVIGRCLDGILDGGRPDELQVVVVCNGCSDGTARVAQVYGEAVAVVETAVASKAAALNIGDRLATGFPRFYVDADVVLSRTDLFRLADVLRRGRFLAVSPAILMDYPAPNGLVCAYYKFWTALPYIGEGMMGSGVYGLSEAGRERFEEFPDLIADDGYIRRLFSRWERTVISGSHSIVTAPATMRDLVKIKTRSRLGEYQLKRQFPTLNATDARQRRYASAVIEVLRRPGLWVSAVPYLWVNCIARLRARRQMFSRNRYEWERDESSRKVAPAANERSS